MDLGRDLEREREKVLLALKGRMGKSIMSQWLQKNGVMTREASEWNELTQILQELIQVQCSLRECSKDEALSIQELNDSIFIIVVEIGLLDLNGDRWRQQLNFLDKYSRKAKFAWILNIDTSNTIKMELRRKGHLLMVNRPLYKAKMIQILDAAIQERNLEQKKKMNASKDDLHECLEIDHIQYEADSSYDSDKSEMGSSNSISELYSKEKRRECEHDVRTNENSSRAGNEQKSLGGVRILLAEDTPVLQRVATIMLEKLGATVVAVGDGMQAVDALKITPTMDDCTRGSSLEDAIKTEVEEFSPYDLILMDCQMPKMDGYEATKAIRKSELGTGSHIPIVALTAHAMSSDEAKCLEVGMDAYLTKPIDCNLMVSTILSLTKRDRLTFVPISGMAQLYSNQS